MFITRKLIKPFEIGLLYRDRAFTRILSPGRFIEFDPLQRTRISVLSQRDVFIDHPDTDIFIKSQVLSDYTELVDVQDHQRALVWIDGRFARVLSAGTHLLFNTFHRIQIEIVNATQVLFEHQDLDQLIESPVFNQELNVFRVQAHERVLIFERGDRKHVLQPGRYAMWKHVHNVDIHRIDLRETVLDLSGQEIMTADRVSVRFNAVLTYAPQDIERIISQVDQLEHSIYREAQLALRASVGARTLDDLLESKQTLTDEMQEQLRLMSERYGVRFVSFGVRDIILPGEMKALLNKITEAKASAEAQLITRREQHAAMRSQANTAKLLEQSATLMEMYKLDILLEMVKTNNLHIQLGERKLSDQLNLLM